jgi:hypothetical protein
VNKEDLKKLKESNKDSVVNSLINELAKEKGFIEVNPELTLKSINEILNKKHSFFKLIDCKLTDVDEGSMAMEYNYDIVFEDDNYKTYGIKLRGTPMVNGELWDDYVANEEDEVFDVYKVIPHKIEIIDYKFELLKK